MKGYVILAAAVAAAAVAACSTVEPQPSASTQPSASNQDDKAYVTGSRIPVKGGGTGSEVQAVGNRQGIDAMMRSSGSSSPPNPGK